LDETGKGGSTDTSCSCDRGSLFLDRRAAVLSGLPWDVWNVTFWRGGGTSGIPSLNGASEEAMCSIYLSIYLYKPICVLYMIEILLYEQMGQKQYRTYM
jgi:hypothetical protein